MSASLVEALIEAGARNPGAAAFINDGRIITHGQLRALIAAAARSLFERGIAPGTVVGLTMGQSPLHCVVMFALARLGTVMVPLSPGLDHKATTGIVRRHGVTAIISDRDAVPVDVEVVFIRITNLTATENELDFAADGYSPDGDTPLCIALTSGTTREPKAILRTHGYLLRRIERGCMQFGPDSRMIPPDLHQTVAQTYAFGLLCAGGCLVFPRSYDLAEMLNAISLHGVTHLLFSPAKAAQLAALLPDRASAFPSLRQFRLVGARPSPALVDMLRSRMTPHIYPSYAFTEIGVVCMASPETLQIAPESAGRITPWARVEVVDAAGRVLPAGQSGEIRVATDDMPVAYVKDEELTRERFRDGWFYPGDRGRFEDGLLYVEGRSDSILNIGGHKAMPEFIEQALEDHPAVREAGVVMAHAGNDEQVLVAAVVTDGQSDLSALTDHCRKRLGVMAPQEFLVLDALPRTETGKLKRDVLAALIERRHTAG